jgi:hypothetical protein
VKSEKTKAVSILFVLLIYLITAGNTFGGPVLCIGADGHVTLEQAFHEHCEHPGHSHQKDVPHLTKEVDSHSESSHCKPCVDIPISTSLTDDQHPQTKVKQDSQTPISFFGQWAIPDNTLISIAATQQLDSVTTHLAPLSTIILLV